MLIPAWLFVLVWGEDDALVLVVLVGVVGVVGGVVLAHPTSLVD